MGVKQEHEEAYRRRAGMIGALASCICTWPSIIDSSTVTGHSEFCPAHSILTRDDSTVSLRPEQCCARDVDGKGSCDVHSAQGVLRSHATRAR